MSFFAELPAQAKALIGGLLLIAMMAVGANFLPRGGSQNGATSADMAAPGQVIIYQNMEQKIAAEAAAELKATQIPFTLVRDGTAIAVPQANADDARVKLALKGLPKEGVFGFSEAFGDKPPGFISTDFEKKLAWNRALNGELSRLIKKIEGVEGASVIVNMPEQQLFTEERKPTTASVMVKLEAERQLTKQQVDGIQHLVASAVPGLKTNNVEVISSMGKLLSDGMAENAGDVEDREVARALDRQLMLTHERESAIESKVQTLLDKLFGPGKSVVRVAVDLDFTQKKTKTILYAPPADQRGNPRDSYRQTQSEISNGGAAGGSSGGVPGVYSNLPRVPTYPLEGVGNANGQGGGTERHSETVQNPQLSTNLTLTEDQVGTIKRMSVTALIQGLPAERVVAMTQIVTAAAGADVGGRGDQIVVQPVAFDSSQTDMLKQLIEQQEAAKQQSTGGKKKEGGIPLSWIIGVGAAFLVLMLLLAIIRLANRKEDTTDVLVNSLGDTGLPSGFDPNALSGYNGMEMTGSVPMAGQDEGPFGFLEQMDPEMVAELLSQERPGTAAGILGLLNPGYADMVLTVMPPEMQEDLINRLQTQPQLPAFQQKTVAQQLKRRLGVPA